MSLQEVPLWAEETINDEVTGIPQRRDLNAEEFLNGWLRLSTVTTQQMNQILYLLTASSKVNPFSPELHLSSENIPSVAVEWVDGGVIDQNDTPLLYEYYGTNFPTLGAAPSGWRYIIRKM